MVGGAGVEECVGEAGDVVEELVAGFFEEVVGLDQVEVGVEGDVGVDVELVADPSDSGAFDSADAGSGAELGVNLVDQVGIDGVHESPVDVAGSDA